MHKVLAGVRQQCGDYWLNCCYGRVFQHQSFMEGSKFFRSWHDSSSEGSSKEDTSSEKSSKECSADDEQSEQQSHADLLSDVEPEFVISDIERVETSGDLIMPLSPPVDPTPGGQWREMNYCLEGYQHHQLARQYAADNNYKAAFREWKRSHLCHYPAALYYIGNCYNQGKGVERNLQKVFQH